MTIATPTGMAIPTDVSTAGTAGAPSTTHGTMEVGMGDGMTHGMPDGIAITVGEAGTDGTTLGTTVGVAIILTIPFMLEVEDITANATALLPTVSTAQTIASTEQTAAP